MREATASEYEAAVRRALERAVADPTCSPADLAEAAGFSAFHFSRMLTGMLGESPGELLKRLRLERAALALKRRERVTEAAFDAGYESLEAFSRAFRAAFGCAPSRFAATGHAARLPAPSELHLTPDGSTVWRLQQKERTTMNIEIQESVPVMRVAALRHVGPYMQIGSAFGRLHQWSLEHGVVGQGALAIYHDDPESVPAEKLRSDACMIVEAGFTSDDPAVPVMDLPGGRYVVATHVGSYEGLGAAWGRLMGEWIPRSGQALDFTRPCFEIYRNMPGEVPEEQLVTELYQPLG